jgi:hypothetical protein
LYKKRKKENEILSSTEKDFTNKMIPRRCSGELYRVLDIQKDATANEIKKAYHKMALQYHPDKTGGTTTEKFKLIQEAHSILHDPDQRKQYDTFGRAGMKQMESMGLPPVSAGMLRLAAFLLSFAFLLLLIFNILVVVKLDDGMSGSWAAVWSPMWIICVVVFCGALPLAKAICSDPSVPMITTFVQLLLFPVCNIVFVLGTEGDIKWSHVTIPFFLSYALEIVRAADGLRFEKFQALYVAMGGAEDITNRSPTYLWAIFSEVLKWGTSLASLGLLAAKLAGSSGYADLSFWAVAAPILARMVFFFCTQLIGAFIAAADCKARVFTFFGLVLGYFPGVYTVCFVAAKVEAEVNLKGGFDPSAAACSAFTFAMIGLGLLASCFVVCCADNVIPQGANPMHAEDGAEVETPDTPQEPYQNMNENTA